MDVGDFKKCELRSAKERVAWLMAKSAHVRVCDTCLLLTFWGTFEKGLHCHERTPAESITRVRRKLQAEGFYLPLDSYVCLKRDVAEKAVRDWSVRG
jgi:hypothetical protein